MSVVGSSTHAATAEAVSSLAHVSWSGVGSPWSSCGAATRVTVVLSTVAATVWAIVPPGWLTVTAMPSITAAVRTIRIAVVVLRGSDEGHGGVVYGRGHSLGHCSSWLVNGDGDAVYYGCGQDDPGRDRPCDPRDKPVRVSDQLVRAVMVPVGRAGSHQAGGYADFLSIHPASLPCSRWPRARTGPAARPDGATSAPLRRCRSPSAGDRPCGSGRRGSSRTARSPPAARRPSRPTLRSTASPAASRAARTGPQRRREGLSGRSNHCTTRRRRGRPAASTSR